MATYVVDAPAVIELVTHDFSDPGAHRLMAPALIRSQALSRLHEAVADGRLERRVARDYFERINSLPIRLLGDSRLRRTAWQVADELGWPTTYDAEYVALTRLHADALITGDPKLVRSLRGVIEVAPVSALL
ncbi:MAG: type II toxin-antitoxin system VapC family toxin [Nocardioidaceae bacterium]